MLTILTKMNNAGRYVGLVLDQHENAINSTQGERPQGFDHKSEAYFAAKALRDRLLSA